MWKRRKPHVRICVKNARVGHKDLQCQSTGFTLLPTHSYMRASSDGLLINHPYHKDNGVFEIKCYFSIDNSTVHNLAPMDR